MEVSNKKSKRLEWDDLDEKQRNCILWPDFLEWGAEEEVVLEKESKDDDLGIITVVLECPETGTCFNIIKQIMEGKSAAKKVAQFDWITAVDEKPTTRVKGRQDLVKLTKNDTTSVCLSIRRAVDPLVNIKQWGSREKEMTLEVYSKDLGFRLAHFYSKVKSDIIDHILIFEVEKDGKSKTLKQLNRGDELLSVNGLCLKRKKLNDIYSLLQHKVVIQVKRIVPSVEYYQEVLRKFALKHPDQIYWRQEKKTVVFEAWTALGLTFLSIPAPKSNSEKEFFHMVSKVTEDTPAFQKNVCVGSRLLSVNDYHITCSEKNEVAELISKATGGFRLVLAAPGGIKQQPLRKKKHSLSRKNSQGDSSSSTTSSSTGTSNPEDGCKSENGYMSGLKQSLLAGSNENKSATAKTVFSQKKLGQSLISTIVEQNNNAYQSTSDESDQDSGDKLCKKCKKEAKKKTCKLLPNDKLKWPIINIDPVSLIGIYNNLDKNVTGTDTNVKVVAGNLELSNEAVEFIVQKHSQHGGQGAAKDFLQAWSELDSSRNVGKLLEILKEIDRKPAVELIMEWMDKDTCKGCGALLEKNTPA